jgi:curli biogenesis system outer membrane secretion channel CsgG
MRDATRRYRHFRLLLNGLLCVLLMPGALLAQARPRVAVLAFENNTTSALFGDRLGLAASDEMATQLTQTGSFTVIERRAIDAILEEQRAGATGVIDPATAASIGKLLGAQAVVVGSITKFAVDRKSGGIGPLSASYTEAESAVDARVIDTTTGEILLVAEGQGKSRIGGAAYKDINLERDFDAGLAQEALRPAIEKTVERIVGQEDLLESLAASAPAGQIVGSRDTDFYIDRGQNLGIEVGQRFEVMRVVDRITDSAGNVLDEVTEKVGIIEVTRVLSQSAICRVIEGEAAEGDKVRPISLPSA